jgi:hypothetical protein
MRNESIDHIMSLVGDSNVRRAETWEDDGKTYIEIYAYSDEEGEYGYTGRVRTYQVPDEVFGAIALLKLQLTNENTIQNPSPKPTKEPIVPLSKETIINLFQTDARYIDAAIKILGDNQTADELAANSTQHHNGIGFSGAYGKTGAQLWSFVTGCNRNGEKVWPARSFQHPRADRTFGRYIKNHGLSNSIELAAKVASVHWRQLTEMLEPGFTLPELPVKNQAQSQPVKKEPIMVAITGAEIRHTTEKSVKVLWDSRFVWLPKSQIKINNGEISVVRWLAEKNGMV